MTNQQVAPEALPDPSPDQLRAIARTARNSSGSASDDCGPLAYVLHGWRAAAIAFRAKQAALVEAQQPATHVQNPAEIEHVAGGVSKNWPESNMAQQPAPSAAAAGEAPLPLLVRDIAADLGTTPIQVCIALAQLGFGGHSVNMAVTPRMAKSLRAHFASTTPQAGSAQDEPLQAFDSPRAKALMRAWEEGWAACRDAEYVGEEAQNDAFNSSHTLTLCIAEDQQLPAPQADSQPAAGAVAGHVDDLAELALLNRLIELGSKAACAHATSNSDDGHKGTAAYVEWQELRAEMGELIRTAYAAAPTPPAQAADSVLEDAALWFAERDNVLHSFWVLLGEAEVHADNDNNPLLKHQVEGFYSQWNALNGTTVAPRWVSRAARKQGGTT